MQKDFDGWNDVKKIVHKNVDRPFFHEREIWYCKLGLNVGYEQDGSGKGFLRPVVIIKKFNNNVCWILPLTKTKKTGKYYFSFSFTNETESTAILSQLRLLDVRRLSHHVGTISSADFSLLTKRLKELFP